MHNERLCAGPHFENEAMGCRIPAENNSRRSTSDQLDLPQVNGYFSPGESKLKIIGARVSTWPQNNRFVPVSCQLLGLVLIHNRNKTSPSCDHTA